MSTKVFLISGLDNYDLNCKQLKEILMTNPNNKMKTCYLFSENECQFYEVMKQTNNYRSFLINNTVVEDGNLYIVTPFDLLFLVLPIFLKKRSQFRSLYDLLTDGFENQMSREMIKAIESKLNHEMVSLIADIKYVSEEMFVKYSSDNSLNWLKCKTDNIIEALKRNNISVSSVGCKASGYTTGKEDLNQDNIEYSKMAFQIISQYLNEEISADLKIFLGLPQDISEANVSTTSKAQTKRKLNENEVSAPLEDYSKNYNSKNNTPTLDNKRLKMTRSQKELLKVDKTGMKTISSFFKPKTK